MPTGNNILTKLRKRGSTILLNSVYSLLVPGLNFLLYLLVLQQHTTAEWGRLVPLLLIVNLVLHFMSWGNLPFLLRSFSQQPAGSVAQWQNAFLARAVFLVLPVAGFFLIYPSRLALWLSLWLVMLFVYRSLEVWVVYYKKFAIAIGAEVAGFALLAYGVVRDPFFVEPTGFAQLFAISMIIRAGVLLFPFAGELFRTFRLKADFHYFKWAFPFFIIALVGLLQEKIDLYLMALMGTEEALGKYHVLISALVILKSGAAFILQPFIKNIYRLPHASLKKMLRRMTLAGLAIVGIGITALWLLIPVLFRFHFDGQVYLLGALFAFPFYYYINLTYRLMKHHREKYLVWISLSATVLNAVMSILLIPRYGLKGALLATTIAEWVLLVVYTLLERQLQQRLSL